MAFEWEEMPNIYSDVDDQNRLTCTMEYLGEVAFDGEDIVFALHLPKIEAEREREIQGEHPRHRLNLPRIVSYHPLVTGDLICSIYKRKIACVVIRSITEGPDSRDFKVVRYPHLSYPDGNALQKPMLASRRFRLI